MPVGGVSALLLSSESLQELEDNDLDALMADLMADLDATEQKLVADRDGPKVAPPDLPLKRAGAVPATSPVAPPTPPEDGGPASSAASPLPAPPPQSAKPTMVRRESLSHSSQVPKWFSTGEALKLRWSSLL